MGTANSLGPQPRLPPREGVPAVAGHGEVGPDLAGGAVRGAVPHAADPVALADQVGHLGGHAQRERRLPPARVGEQVEQVPLRRHRDVGVGDVQPAEVPERHAAAVAGREDDLLDPGVRQPGELVGQAQLVEQLQRGGVHGVAAEVAEEVGVLLQHRHLDPGAGQQQSQHHPGRAAPHDQARRVLTHRRPPSHASGHRRSGSPAPPQSPAPAGRSTTSPCARDRVSGGRARRRRGRRGRGRRTAGPPRLVGQQVDGLGALGRRLRA
jgi:hypothetical protein